MRFKLKTAQVITLYLEDVERVKRGAPQVDAAAAAQLGCRGPITRVLDMLPRI